MNNVSQLNLRDSLVAKSLQSLMPMKMVADISGYNNDPMFTIFSYLNKGKSTFIDYDLYTTAQIPNLSIINTVNTVTQSGSNLIITYTPNAGIDPYRSNWTVLDSNQVQARIIAHSPGSLTVEPNGTVLVAGTHFASGTFIKNGWNLSVNAQSRKTESLTYTPDNDYNYPSVSRNTVYVDLNDKINSRPQMQDNYWWYAQERIGIQQWVKEIGNKWLLDSRGQVQGYDGLRNTNGGVIWSIMNRNGGFQVANAVFTLQNLQDIILEIKNKDNTQELNLACFFGNAAYAAIQLAIGEFVKFAGQNSTFKLKGETIVGTNITMYKLLDCTLTFHQMPEFNNPLGMFSDPCSYNPGTTRGQNSVIVMNLNDLPASGGGSVPVAEIFHRGQRPVFYKHQPGVTEGGSGSVEMEDFQSPVSDMAISDLPGLTAMMYTYSGINIRDAKGMFYWQG